MKRYFSLLFLLLLLTACGGTTASQPAPSPTPIPAITPTPTIPDIPSRKVQFVTPDHVKLTGLLFGRGQVAVVCSHMRRSTKQIWSDSGIAQQLAQRGYLVLTYDFRGNGDSEGKSDITKLDVDLRAAMAFIHQQGATKIILMGASMGGSATLDVASKVPVAAAITLSAPLNFEVDLTNEVPKISVPKLFINSQNDDYAQDTQQMFDSARPPKEIHLYPGGAHGTAIFDGDNGADLTARILAFVARYVPAS
ncbi:MAG: alpha/beta fold hydrolase [Ktedonobacteraceae bacterium]|nr:alpha/beta fold hydrolase [Ktedonobacteraceae bacterium]